MAIPTYDRPPRGNDRPHLPLVRLPAKAKWAMAITCWELLQIDTHFIGRRTLPHFDEACPGCQAKRPKRYEAYMSAIRAGDKKHLIVALTLPAVNNLLDNVPNAKQLRGHIIDIERTGHRLNGMLKVTVAENLVSNNNLPDAPDLWAHLGDIWNLDRNHVGSDNPDYREALQHQLDEARNQHGARDQRGGEIHSP